MWATLLIKCRVTAGHQPTLARRRRRHPPTRARQSGAAAAVATTYTKSARAGFILEPGSGRRRPHHGDNIRSTHCTAHLLEPPLFHGHAYTHTCSHPPACARIPMRYTYIHVTNACVWVCMCICIYYACTQKTNATRYDLNRLSRAYSHAHTHTRARLNTDTPRRLLRRSRRPVRRERLFYHYNIIILSLLLLLLYVRPFVRLRLFHVPVFFFASTAGARRAHRKLPNISSTTPAARIIIPNVTTGADARLYTRWPRPPWRMGGGGGRGGGSCRPWSMTRLAVAAADRHTMLRIPPSPAAAAAVTRDPSYSILPLFPSRGLSHLCVSTSRSGLFILLHSHTRAGIVLCASSPPARFRPPPPTPPRPQEPPVARRQRKSHRLGHFFLLL